MFCSEFIKNSHDRLLNYRTVYFDERHDLLFGWVRQNRPMHFTRSGVWNVETVQAMKFAALVSCKSCTGPRCSVCYGIGLLWRTQPEIKTCCSSKYTVWWFWSRSFEFLGNALCLNKILKSRRVAIVWSMSKTLYETLKFFPRLGSKFHLCK